MKYQWANPENVGVIRQDGEIAVYIDSGPEYEAALKSGPAPYNPPALDLQAGVVVPSEVSRFQALAALMDAGLFGDVQKALETAGPLAQLAFAEVSVFERQSSMVFMIGAGLGLSDEAVDKLFIAAAAIKV